MTDKMTYSVTELVELLGISRPRVYDLLHKGAPCIRVGRKLVIPAKAFDAWLAERASEPGIPDVLRE